MTYDDTCTPSLDPILRPLMRERLWYSSSNFWGLVQDSGKPPLSYGPLHEGGMVLLVHKGRGGGGEDCS